MEGFYAHDKFELSTEQAEALEKSVRRIFNFGNYSNPKRSSTQEQKTKRYISSSYRRIMPEEIEVPLMTRRVRVMFSGFNHVTHEGFMVGDHWIGVALLDRIPRQPLLDD